MRTLYGNQFPDHDHRPRQTTGRSPPKRERARPAPQPVLPTRKELDLRVAANKHFAQIVNSVVADLGEARVSTVQEGLIEAWAGCRINLDILNARLLRGEPVDQS